MLYTRKGDDGTTKTFSCDQRISKSSAIAEALGTLDEINSYLGLCKVESQKPTRSHEGAGGEKITLPNGILISKVLHDVQENLFIIQAEVAGASMSIDEAKIKEVEKMVDAIEKELPPIKTFFISGGTKLAVYLDIARTISRRAERRVVEVHSEKKVAVSANTLSYLNRLSSLLYALARLSNHFSGINEESPEYK